ncbi:sensor domain-containing diguanylate cyclase [Enterovibrio sp. ZSDZ35]|uniref:Sensor domain-containing diguanylate cyclase n=1 Tax=Enterovibrio qingdaonensis TaxID=2899818 RepID=A0ABT5QQ24_9GAMM|nr:sensor domain-containing diguanylate cyclase [Enterovibrio sp. ZSDZ35]MDD1783084.1 sensor domain-containing diguanylate cyclase [Enterovibrio sp. ZSDZ35]
MINIDFNKHFLTRFLLFSVFFLAAMYLVLLSHIVTHKEKLDDRAAARQLTIIESQKHYIQSTMKSVVKDTLFVYDLSGQLRIYDYLDQVSSPNSEEVLSTYKALLYAFVKRKGIYDQVRYLDTSGRERVRINFNQGCPEIVEDAQLQSKGARYYFQEALALSKHQIYVSPLDLNMERKKIEIPYKPMIRLSIPVFDDKGEKRGLVVLNYLASHLLDGVKLLALSDNVEYMLVNADGYYLSHTHHPEKEFSFMFDKDSQQTIYQHFPGIESLLKSAEPLQIDREEGLFTAASIGPKNAVNPYCFGGYHVKNGRYLSWELISLIPRKTNSLIAHSFSNYGSLIAFLSVVCVLAGYITARYQQNRKLAVQRVFHLAHTDALSGLHNRMSFEKNVQRALDNQHTGFLLYIDLDDFKQVNDDHSHFAGDSILLHVADSMRAIFGESAILGRLGGDEFSAFVYHTNKQHDIKEQVGLLQTLIKSPITYDGEYIRVGSSIGGVEVCSFDTDLPVLMQRADQAMYVAKRLGKDQAHILTA